MDSSPNQREYVRCDWQHDVSEESKVEFADSVEAHRAHGPGNMAGCDTFLCVPECGNNTRNDGFYPCDAAGNEVEPDERWDGIRYVCGRCGRIINQQTGAVIGRKASRN